MGRRVSGRFAHITGGGLTENLPRVFPNGLGCSVDLGAWDLPPVFKWLAEQGGMEQGEMLKTFNAGIGMVVIVTPEAVADVTAALEGEGQTVVSLGHVHDGQGVTYKGQLW